MSTCDFNSSMFKKFISMDKTIIPALTDDWVIVPSSYNTKSGFGLKSDKLGYTVQDIHLRQFLRFIGEENITINGLKLVGSYIVAQDRNVYKKEIFDQWKEKFDKRAENIIEKKDLEVGCEYKTICGASFFYLGTGYVSSIKQQTRNRIRSEGDKFYYEEGNKHVYDYNFVSKNKREHFIIWGEVDKSTATIFPPNRKVAEKLDTEKLSDEVIKNQFEQFQLNSKDTIFNKTKPDKNSTINPILFDKHKKGYGNYEYFFKIKGHEGIYCIDTKKECFIRDSCRRYSGYNFTGEHKNEVYLGNYKESVKELAFKKKKDWKSELYEVIPFPLLKVRIEGNKVITTPTNAEIMDTDDIEKVVRFEYKA